MFLSHWTEAADPVAPFPDPPTIGPDRPDRAALLEYHEVTSGRSVERIPWNLAFAAWRLALIFEAVASRSAAGAYGALDAAEERRLAEVTSGLVDHAGRLLLDDER